MFKDHWCGDDFDIVVINVPPRTRMACLSTFSACPGEWYHIQTHIQMNTAGDATDPVNFLTNGKLKTWLDGELVVDKNEMAWRQYNNVTIDTLYFRCSSESSPTFQAKR
jgi:hypothetical protein